MECASKQNFNVLTETRLDHVMIQHMKKQEKRIRVNTSFVVTAER
jgi:hypothetical protein